MNAPSAPTLTLNNGIEMPRLGLGTWPMKGRQASDAVTAALASGYRLIDTAAAYGNEQAVGTGMRDCGIARSELFVTTKLANAHHGYESALRAYDASASALGLDYIDLYLIHWPMPGLGLYVETWRALEHLLDTGAVRAIGVSNFKPAHLDTLIDATEIVPAVNQIELNPRTNRRESRDHHSRTGIITESWSPLGPGSDLFSEPVIRRLSTKYEKSPGQIVLRWHIELGLVATPKSATPQRIAENIEIFDFEMTDSDVHAISALDTGAVQAVDSDQPLSPPPGVVS